MEQVIAKIMAKIMFNPPEERAYMYYLLFLFTLIVGTVSNSNAGLDWVNQRTMKDTAFTCAQIRGMWQLMKTFQCPNTENGKLAYNGLKKVLKEEKEHCNFFDTDIAIQTGKWKENGLVRIEPLQESNVLEEDMKPFVRTREKKLPHLHKAQQLIFAACLLDENNKEEHIIQFGMDGKLNNRTTLNQKKR